MSDHRTAKCIVKEQVMFDSLKMLEATKKLVGAVTTSNTVSVRGVRIALFVDEFELMNISSGNDGSSRIVELVKSSFESNVESSISLSIKVELIVNVRI